MREKEEEENYLPDAILKCAICGEELRTKFDSQDPEVIWASCLSCSNFASETWEELQEERKEMERLKVQLRKIDGLYNDLQDHVKALFL